MGPARPTEETVPSLDFQNLNYVAGMPGRLPRPDHDTYNGPSTLVRRIAVAVAAQDAVLPVKAPSANSTWELEFRAPSIRCDDVAGDNRNKIEQSVQDYLSGGEGCEAPPFFMAWFPRPGENDNLIDEPYTAGVNSSNGLDSFLADADAVFSMERGNEPNDTVIMDDTAFFIAAFPGLTVAKSFSQSSFPLACDLSSTYHDGTSGSAKLGVTKTSPLGVLGRNATVLQCRLLNSTYLTNFNFDNGAQNVDINLIRSEEDEEVHY